MSEDTQEYGFELATCVIDGQYVFIDTLSPDQPIVTHAGNPGARMDEVFRALRERGNTEADRSTSHIREMTEDEISGVRAILESASADSAPGVHP